MAKANPRSKILRHMTVSYMIFLLIPIVMGSMFLYMASRVLWNNLSESNSRHLSSGAMMISDSLSAADDFTLALSQNETLLQLMNNQNQTNSYTIRHVANSMPRLRTANGIVDRYFFYYYGMNEADCYIITPQRTFRKPALYYDSCFRYGNMSSDEFWAFIKSNTSRHIYPAMETHYFNTPSQSLLMLSPYTVNNSTKIVGHFLIYFDLDRIMRLFDPLFEGGVEWLGIYDGSGQLLSASSNTDFSNYISIDLLNLRGEGTQIVSGDSGKYTIQYCRDLSSGWFFVSLTPNQFFTAQTAPLLWVVLAGVSLFIILAFCLIRILNKNTQRPLAQIVNMLPLENDGQRGLWSLTESVERFRTDHEKLCKQLGERNTQLRDAAIVQLIKGTFEDEQELRLLLSHTGVEIDESTE